jgi:hypothetical protein
MIRFEVDSVKSEGFCMVVPGRVHHGTIRVGSVFTRADEMSAGPLTTTFRVDKIIAYDHSLDELPEGMTGELQLTGKGSEILLHLKCHFTCIGESEE